MNSLTLLHLNGRGQTYYYYYYYIYIYYYQLLLHTSVFILFKDVEYGDYLTKRTKKIATNVWKDTKEIMLLPEIYSIISFVAFHAFVAIHFVLMHCLSLQLHLNGRWQTYNYYASIMSLLFSGARAIEKNGSSTREEFSHVNTLSYE